MERENIIGRSLCLASSVTIYRSFSMIADINTSSVKALGVPERPIKPVGLTALTTSNKLVYCCEKSGLAYGIL